MEEVQEGFGVIPLGEEEIDTIPGLFNIGRIVVRVVLENELLKMEERPLVRNVLSHLHAGTPMVLGVRLGAIRALLVHHHIDNFEGLLKDDIVGDRVLDGELQLDPAGVRLCPDERRIDNADFVEAFQFSEANGHQLARFGGGDGPCCRGEKPAFTVTTEIQSRFTLDSLRNVHRGFHAIVA